MNRHIRHTILLTLAIVVMAACGGGGSDVPSPAPTPTPTPTPTNPTNPDPEPTPEPTPIPEPTPESQQVLIGFRADLSDAVASTRAMAVNAGKGELTTDLLKEKGFGVYCWYTGTTDFTTPKASTNMLMRNQKVEWKKWDGENSSWNYTPSKYWPLNPAEMLTFRAYAPYTDYLKEDASGMPQLPVVVKATDYHNGSQQDPVWGTGKLLQTTGVNAGEYYPDNPAPPAEPLYPDNRRYGSHYDNITYKKSGDWRDWPSDHDPADTRDGFIDWYFHHGMAKLIFKAKLEGNASGTAEIVSITIGPLYDKGLLSINSPAADNSDKPTWNISGAGDLDPVVLYGVDAPDGQDLDNYTVSKDELTLLTSKGLLIIPRSYVEDSELTITVSYKSSGGQINTVTTKLPNKKSEVTEYVFEGNTIYTVNLTVGNALVAEIESVNVATMKTNWTNIYGNDHEVYNW